MTARGAIFFDLDGTLFDTRADLAATVNHTRRDLGLAALPTDEVIVHVGRGARYLLEHAIAETDRPYDDLWRIFIGHFIIIMPYIVRNTVSVHHVFNWTLEDAAASLGADPVQVFFKITIPLAKPGVLAGALLAFLYSFDEVALSGLLSTPKFITLPVRLMNYMELTFDPVLAAI